MLTEIKNTPTKGWFHKGYKLGAKPFYALRRNFWKAFSGVKVWRRGVELDVERNWVYEIHLKTRQLSETKLETKLKKCYVILSDYEGLKSGKQQQRRLYNKSRVRIGPITNFEIITEDEETDLERFIPAVTSQSFIPVPSPMAEKQNQINEAIESYYEDSLERGMEGNHCF